MKGATCDPSHYSRKAQIFLWHLKKFIDFEKVFIDVEKKFFDFQKGSQI